MTETEEFSASTVFNLLVCSSAFEPQSGSIETKGRIFGKFWSGGDASWLQEAFGSDGKEPQTGDSGFGFLVECFARHSDTLPKNTESGEQAARSILSALHHGNSEFVQLGRSRSNSDFLWVNYKGRLITVTGMGEVKSSANAAKEKIGGQLKRQEESLRFLAEKLETGKTVGAVHEFFHKRKVVVREGLDKVLIVPFGQGEELKHDEKFSGWRVVELEFSYNELAFIAQQLWPDFRPDLRFGPGRLSALDQTAIRLSEWIRPRLDGIFVDHSLKLPYFELGLFILAAKKIPLSDEQVQWSAELVRKAYWPAVQNCLNLFASSNLDKETSEEKWKKLLYKKFLYILTPSRDDLHFFISFVVSLQNKIKDIAREEGKSDHLKEMGDYNLLAV